MELTNDFGIKALEAAQKAGELYEENRGLKKELGFLRDDRRNLQILLDNLRMVGDDYVGTEDSKEIIKVLKEYKK